MSEIFPEWFIPNTFDPCENILREEAHSAVSISDIQRVALPLALRSPTNFGIGISSHSRLEMAVEKL